MNQETKNTSNTSVQVCQNCKNDFVIEPEDFVFYDKIKVPPPTFCPECRLIRRLMWRNNRSLYSRICGLCSKDLISFLKDDGVPVYCLSCYSSDNWDRYEYQMNYDFNNNFFKQLDSLINKQPRIFQITLGNNVNSEYSNSIGNVKNLYLSFSSIESNDILYSENVDKSKNCIDCLSIQESDNCFWNINSERNFNSHFLVDSENCLDSYFLYDCSNCSNCFMSSNLRNQSYYFYNQKLTKEKYLEAISKLEINKYSNLEKLKNDFRILFKNSIHKYSKVQSSNNFSGDIILNSNNIKKSFDIRNSENVSYSYRSINVKDIMDCGWTLQGELEYESMTGSGGSYNQVSCFMCTTSRDVAYSISCKNCLNCFGCVGLTNAEYCILNKQYSKEEYFKMVEKIKQHMTSMPYIDRENRIFKYGEFFPYDLSFFGYNESLAHDFFPLDKKAIEDKGYKYTVPRHRNYEDVFLNEELPDNIEDVSSVFLNKIITCPNNGNELTLCTGAYKIHPDELQFYKQKNLPLPRYCPNCRHYERLEYRNPLRLWHRACMKEGCNNEFETSYAPDRPEIVYCEKCYQQEVM